MYLNIVTIFGAGVLTFLTPCVLPLVPIYLTSLVGGDVRALSQVSRGHLLWRASLFSLGFLAVFTAMGLGASSLGQALAAHRTVVQTLGGVIVLLFALKFLQIVQMPWLDRVLCMDNRWQTNAATTLGAFLTGVIFAAAWSPCVGPVLGSVLTYTASTTSNPAVGMAYLAAFGAGVAVPLLLTAAFAEAGRKLLARLRSGLPYFERALGATLLVVSSTLLFGIDVLPDPIPSTYSQPVQAAAVSSSDGSSATMLALVSRDCPVCQGMKPVLADVTQHCQGQGVLIETIDVGEPQNRHFIDEYRLVGVPTLVFMDARGQEVARLIGKQTKAELLQALAAVRGETCEGVGPLPALGDQTGTPTIIESPPAEATSCQSTNSSATTVDTRSISNAASLSGASQPLAQSASARAGACSVASP